MKITKIYFIMWLLISASVVFGKTLKKHDDKAKRIKHYRIAPMGGMIGFVKEKYYDEPKKVFSDDVVLFYFLMIILL